MAGTAPACTEVLSTCIPVYDSFLDTISLTAKNDKKEKSSSGVLDLFTKRRNLKSETDNTTFPYQFRKMKVVAGHTALNPLSGKATLLCD